MQARLAALFLFGTLSASCLAPALAQSRRAAVRWTSSAPEAARREVYALALAGRPIRVALEDGTTVAGTIGEVGPETFSLRTDRPVGTAEVRWESVRGLAWTEHPPSRAAKAKAAVERLAKDPDSLAEVWLANREVVKGRIREPRELAFRIVEEGSGAERTVDYREVERVSGTGIPEPGIGVLRDVGLYALLILELPLFVLAVLSGWDGC
jgi:hypothetical protein